MAPSISFSVTSKPYHSISGLVVFKEIFKALKSVDIQNNIRAVTFRNNT